MPKNRPLTPATLAALATVVEAHGAKTLVPAVQRRSLVTRGLVRYSGDWNTPTVVATPKGIAQHYAARRAAA